MPIRPPFSHSRDSTLASLWRLSEAIQPELPAPDYAALGRRAWVEVSHDEQSETLIEIYLGRGRDRRLITAIELLSPTNKTPGEKGRDLYLRKQAEMMDSKSHLVEIDLLRGGQHTTAVPENWMRKFVPAFVYHVCAHCFDHFEDFLVYPIQLRDALPKINIPLLPGDGDVPVNLQQVFEETYAAGPYFREIDYNQPVPPPSLSDADQQWVERKKEARR